MDVGFEHLNDYYKRLDMTWMSACQRSVWSTCDWTVQAAATVAHVLCEDWESKAGKVRRALYRCNVSL